MTTLPARVFALLALLLVPVSAAAQDGPGDLDRWIGDWAGALETGAQSLPLVFHVVEGPQGLRSTMDSPAQGAFAIPMDETSVSGDTLTIRLRAAQASYVGVLDEDGVLRGSWSQGPASLPLDLVREEGGDGEGGGDAGAESEEEASNPTAPSAQARIPDPADRPQTPRPPFPYQVREVSIPNEADGITLAGTLTLPRGDGPFPGVILVTGSGPQDRDETVMGHKPFAVLADHLTRRGIAVLRYDDRGVGRSEGDFRSADTRDLARDAEAALERLAREPEVDPDRVGIAGHSEGGIIAPMVATRSSLPAFLVLLAPPGVTGSEIILSQSEAVALARGSDPASLEEGLGLNRALFRISLESEDREEAARRMRTFLRDTLDAIPPERRAAMGMPQEIPEQAIETQVAQLTSPWFHYFLRHDPAPVLESVEVPVLALTGSLDLQVAVPLNTDAVRDALGRGGNPDYEVVVLEGLNHLFQTAETGSPDEYAEIDETMSPQVLERTAEWILARFGS